TFHVYALQDDTRSYRYIDNKKLFAFADSPVVVGKNTPSKTLYAYQAVKPTDINPASTAGKPNAADRRLKFQTTVKNNTQDLLQKFRFEFERPLRTYDTSKIRFTSDTSFTPLSGYSWSLDSTRKKLTLNYTLAEDTRYNFVLQKDFATDTLGQQLLRADTIRFTTMKTSDYGKLSIRFRNLDLSKNPVLQFIQNGAVVSSHPLTADIFSQPMFLPGEYEMRILYDTNKNGVWDPGQFFGRHKQPELVKPVPRKSVVIKANWDNEFEISL
ncbi:MAG TPA: Ig-like domain-containing protein, partial [Ferruginibacter sp.]|nr:Ig-like domain-containing protein [Ferruginibacter sp.]